MHVILLLLWIHIGFALKSGSTVGLIMVKKRTGVGEVDEKILQKDTGTGKW
jgi:hypothetical protein